MYEEGVKYVGPIDDFVSRNYGEDTHFYNSGAYRVIIGSIICSHSFPAAEPVSRLRVNISLWMWPPRED